MLHIAASEKGNNIFLVCKKDTGGEYRIRDRRNNNLEDYEYLVHFLKTYYYEFNNKCKGNNLSELVLLIS